MLLCVCCAVAKALLASSVVCSYHKGEPERCVTQPHSFPSPPLLLPRGCRTPPCSCVDEFQPSPQFAGARPGFAFARRQLGTGYYRDHPPKGKGKGCYRDHHGVLQGSRPPGKGKGFYRAHHGVLQGSPSKRQGQGMLQGSTTGCYRDHPPPGKGKGCCKDHHGVLQGSPSTREGGREPPRLILRRMFIGTNSGIQDTPRYPECQCQHLIFSTILKP